MDAPTTRRALAVSLQHDRTVVAVGADTYSILLSGKQTAGHFAVLHFLVPSGGGPPPHSHEAEEAFLVLEGEVVVFCHDARTKASTGAAINIPGWAPHCFRNLSPAPARLLCIVSPAGLEEQFVEVGVPVPSDTSPAPPPDPARLAALAGQLPAIVEKYHGRLLPPEIFNHLMTPEELDFLEHAKAQ